jgi:dipeptidase
VAQVDAQVAELDEQSAVPVLEEANEAIAEKIRTETDALLSRVLFLASEGMTNHFSRSDD